MGFKKKRQIDKSSWCIYSNDKVGALNCLSRIKVRFNTFYSNILVCHGYSIVMLPCHGMSCCDVKESNVNNHTSTV